jgi:hypothetical protein
MRWEDWAMGVDPGIPVLSCPRCFASEIARRSWRHIPAPIVLFFQVAGNAPFIEPCPFLLTLIALSVAILSFFVGAICAIIHAGKPQNPGGHHKCRVAVGPTALGEY